MQTQSAPQWQRHRPEATPLYSIVRDHLGPFARFAEERYADDHLRDRRLAALLVSQLAALLALDDH